MIYHIMSTSTIDTIETIETIETIDNSMIDNLYL